MTEIVVVATPPPLVALLGAPGTGAEALANALRQRVAPGALQITACTNVPHTAALVLLMGRDRPEQEAADAHLRAALAASGMAYQVLYGHSTQQLENALKAIEKIAANAYPESAVATFDTESTQLRAWHCEKCSDPECEHRLFTGLVKRSAPDRA